MNQAHPRRVGLKRERGERPLPIRSLPLVVSLFASAVVAAVQILPTPALLTLSTLATAHPTTLFALTSHALFTLTSLAFFSLVVSHDGSPFWEALQRTPENPT